MASDEAPAGPAESPAASHPPLTHNSNAYLGPIAEGAARREVRYLDDGRRITFYSYRAGTHVLPAASPVSPLSSLPPAPDPQ